MVSYRPGSGGHAIEQAVVGLRVLRPVPENQFHAAFEAAAKLAAEHNLPGRMQLDPLSLAFGRQVISSGYNQSELTPGVLFQRVNPDGSMAEELTIDRSAVTYRTRSYRRWADVVALINGILTPVASILCGDDINQLSVVELKCIDRFVAEQPSAPPLSELLSRQSPYVAAHLLEKTELLHMHLGWFQDVSDAGRTLVNINVDLVDSENEERVASILQVISRQASGVGAALQSGGSFAASIVEQFAILHALDKSILAGLLKDELQESINLKGSSGVEGI